MRALGLSPLCPLLLHSSEGSGDMVLVGFASPRINGEIAWIHIFSSYVFLHLLLLFSLITSSFFPCLPWPVPCPPRPTWSPFHPFFVSTLLSDGCPWALPDLCDWLLVGAPGSLTFPSSELPSAQSLLAPETPHSCSGPLETGSEDTPCMGGNGAWPPGLRWSPLGESIWHLCLCSPSPGVVTSTVAPGSLEDGEAGDVMQQRGPWRWELGSSGHPHFGRGLRGSAGSPPGSPSWISKQSLLQEWPASASLNEERPCAVGSTLEWPLPEVPWDFLPQGTTQVPPSPAPGQLGNGF